LRLTELTGASAPGQGGVEIAGLAADSREVRPGFLFAALSGSKTDGGRFIDDALRNGAAAILAAPNAALEEMLAARGVPFVADANPRLRLARLAAAFFGAQPDTVAAVTGTNGKTSVATFTRQIWTSLGHRAASLGTLGVQGPGFEVTLAHTTPDPVLLHRLLAELAAAGVDHLAMEASSHGLDQYRLDGVRIRAAAFTNLTHDHLDYHADVEAYFAAKMRLFDAVLPEGGVAVVNADSDWYDAVRQRIASRGHRLIGYGVKAGDLRIERLTPHAHGIQLEATIFGTRQVIDLPLVGAFQAANALCALGLAIACGAEISPAVAALGRLTGVPGRMQSVATTPTGAPVFVDYAHTPDALQTVLTALRPHAIGRLAVVFGCGGDRDRTKRPLMGRIAANLADLVYVTDDNPRGEEPAAIRAAILATCPGAVEIGDRGEAIRTAIAGLHAGDVLVIAGKGHEQGQNVGGVVRPFDDASVARAAIATLPSSRQVH
jgi:UDP-N-acetylmuramoyl-L-alanyl-D-glutamate--2,6-diaminopimelate ligase